MIVESYEDVIRLSGALRSNFWDTLHTAISLTLKRHPTGVIIDCSGLAEATAVGAETFHDIIDFIRDHDARVILASVPENVLEVLRSVPDVRSQLAISDSVEDARKSLDLLASPVQRGRKSAPQYSSRIVLWLTGGAADRETPLLASQLAEAREAELHLVYVVIVPRELPLTAPLPKEESLASAALDKARELLDKTMRCIPHVERGRDVAGTIETVVLAQKAALVVLPLSSGAKEGDGHANLVRTVLGEFARKSCLFAAPRPASL